eukprot:4368387-Pyramimonas_sp.AAC.1
MKYFDDRLPPRLWWLGVRVDHPAAHVRQHVQHHVASIEKHFGHYTSAVSTPVALELLDRLQHFLTGESIHLAMRMLR